MTSATWPEIPMPPEPPGWPERPGYPYPPARPVPRREGPVMVPIVDLPDGAASAGWRRRVLLSGPIDTGTAMRLAAELMELDGRSGEDVELVINSDGGRLGDVLGPLDVIGSMRARVRTVCMGRATGTAAVLLSCGTGGRRAGVHATISLRCTQPEQLEGPPAALRRQLDDVELVRSQVLAALARATGRPVSELAEQLDAGPLLDPAGAAALGLIDAVAPG
jgi:ATP-dependent Clp protease, protease subunit